MSIKVENVNYIYGKNTPFEKKAVDDISFEIKKGEFIGLIGHTGSGKSTLIQMLNGLIKPDSGSVFINGVDITGEKINLKEVRNKIGLVFQYPEYQLFEETVRKDISYGPLNFGKSQAEIDVVIDEVASLVGLDKSVLDKSPFELSGGQKRRVAIAGILAMSPEILVLDEPTAGLDPAGRNDILNCIRRLHDEKKITVILVSHSMEDIANYADRIIILSKGSLVAFDTPENIFKDSDKLKNIGLNVPQVTRVVNHLKQKGIVLKGNIYTVDGAVDAILNYIKDGHK